MNRKNAEGLLKEYSRFANLRPDDPRLKALATRLLNHTVGYGDLTPDGFMGIDYDCAAKLHCEINSILEQLARGEDCEVWLKNVNPVIAMYMQKDGYAPSIRMEPWQAETALFFMFFFMMIVGVKEVIRCPGCGKYFFRTGRPRKYCSGTCRQRCHRLKKTPKEIEQENAERREEYRIKQGN